MRKIIAIAIAVLVLISCAVDPSVSSDNPRTLYIISAIFTYGDSGTYYLPVVNNLDFIAEIESIYKRGDSGFDEIRETIFHEEDGVFYIKNSFDDPGRAGKWTASDDFIPALKDIRDNADNNDLVIFFFSGHGLESTDENLHGSLCFYNPDVDNLINPVAPADLIYAFSTFKCNVLAVFNSCHSGRFTDLTSGTMADGLIVDNFSEDGSNVPGEIDAKYSISEAIGDAMTFQFDSTKAGNRNVWVISAATAEQSEYMFGIPGDRVWSPFLDYLTQGLYFNEESGIYAASGTDRITAADLYNYVVELSKKPMLEAETSFPEDLKSMFSESYDPAMTLLETQVSQAVKTPVDLVIF